MDDALPGLGCQRGRGGAVRLESLREGHGIGLLETWMIGVELCVGVQKVTTQSGNKSTGENSTNKFRIMCLSLISHF